MQASTLLFPCKDSQWNTPRLEKPHETGTNKPFPAVTQSYKDAIKMGGFIIPQLVYSSVSL